jgi:hypothetical protein
MSTDSRSIYQFVPTPTTIREITSTPISAENLVGCADKINTSHFSPLNQHKKFLAKGQSGTQTGKQFNLNFQNKLCVVDIDVDHSLSDEQKEKIRDEIVGRIFTDVVYTKTGNGGLHIFCLWDETIIPKSNRMTNAATIAGIEGVKGINIFITVDPKKHSHVVFAGSSIKCDNGSIGKYEFLFDTNEDTLITGKLEDVMNNAEIEMIGVEYL